MPTDPPAVAGGSHRRPPVIAAVRGVGYRLGSAMSVEVVDDPG
ncbi:hypothetical protein [Micromonospora marina]